LNYTSEGYAEGGALHVAQRFERLVDAHRRPDGGRWTGQQLDEATDGVVARSYLTNLRKGRIESPGYEKMLAIARAMGFPPEAWLDEATEGVVARSYVTNLRKGRIESPATRRCWR
jgi:hypothetical protein